MEGHCALISVPPGKKWANGRECQECVSWKLPAWLTALKNVPLSSSQLRAVLCPLVNHGCPGKRSGEDEQLRTSGPWSFWSCTYPTLWARRKTSESSRCELVRWGAKTSLLCWVAPLSHKAGVKQGFPKMVPKIIVLRKMERASRVIVFLLSTLVWVFCCHFGNSREI